MSSGIIISIGNPDIHTEIPQRIRPMAPPIFLIILYHNDYVFIIIFVQIHLTTTMLYLAQALYIYDVRVVCRTRECVSIGFLVWKFWNMVEYLVSFIPLYLRRVDLGERVEGQAVFYVSMILEAGL